MSGRASSAGRVLIVGDGFVTADASVLGEGVGAEVVLAENQERPQVAINFLTPDLVKHGLDAIRLVLEYGAAAVELEAIVHRLREPRGRRTRIEVSNPPAIYELPVDLGETGIPDVPGGP